MLKIPIRPLLEKLYVINIIKDSIQDSTWVYLWRTQVVPLVHVSRELYPIQRPKLKHCLLFIRRGTMLMLSGRHDIEHVSENCRVILQDKTPPVFSEMVFMQHARDSFDLILV